MRSRRSIRHAAAIRAVAGYPFVDRPGRAFAYSDLGFMLLGETVRRVRGAPLDAIVRELARRHRPHAISPTDRWTPGSSASGSSRPASTSCGGIDVAGARSRTRTRRGWAGSPAMRASSPRPTTSPASVTPGGLGSPALGVEPALIDEATRDQTAGLDVTRGLGWQLRGSRPQDEDASHLAPLGPGAFGHTGFTGTSIAIDPTRDLVIVLLTNRVYAVTDPPGHRRGQARGPFGDRRGSNPGRMSRAGLPDGRPAR